VSAPVTNRAPHETRWRAVAGGGVLLLAIGGALFAARASHTIASLAVAGAGAVAVAIALVVNRASVVAFSRRRAARRGADAVLATLMFTSILVVVQATSARRSVRFDLTRNHRNTLAPQSEAVLDSLTTEVTATGFYRQNSATRTGADGLLALYARRSPRFHYEILDPDRNPDRAERMNASVDQIVVESGGVRRTIADADEESITNAIVQVTRHREKVVYFVNGHGEKDVDSGARDGYRTAATGLTGQGYAVRTVSLVNVREVPADCAVLVIAGPREDFIAGEVSELDVYLREGGAALFMLDPRVDIPRLASVLKRYRLELIDAVVLDDLVLNAGDRSFDATVTKIRRYERHPITTGFNFVTMFPKARPVHIVNDSTIVGVDTQYLCITDAQAWGETNMDAFRTGHASRDGDDIAGPMPIAAVSSVTPIPRRVPDRTSRLVLVGDSDYANNSFYGVLGNADFFQNIIAFLAKDENLIKIRPRAALGDSVYITASQGRLVFAVCLVLLPLIPLVFGVVVVVRRRAL
jgi:gliding motility-associatede transport system auxiliary component